MEARKSKLDHPICALCAVLPCEAGQGGKEKAKFCAMSAEPELLKHVEGEYFKSGTVRDLAIASAQTEASGYMRRTRVEEIMDFARRIGAQRLGIAHCIGLMNEATLTMEIFTVSYYRRLRDGESADDCLRSLMGGSAKD